jgi:hypothetical protein
MRPLDLGQITPSHPAPAAGLPAAVVNLGVVVFGAGVGILGYQNRKSAMGAVALGAGSSIAGAGLILLVLDIFGFKPIQF